MSRLSTSWSGGISLFSLTVCSQQEVMWRPRVSTNGAETRRVPIFWCEMHTVHTVTSWDTLSNKPLNILNKSTSCVRFKCTRFTFTPSPPFAPLPCQASWPGHQRLIPARWLTGFCIWRSVNNANINTAGRHHRVFQRRTSKTASTILEPGNRGPRWRAWVPPHATPTSSAVSPGLSTL